MLNQLQKDAYFFYHPQVRTNPIEKNIGNTVMFERKYLLRHNPTQ